MYKVESILGVINKKNLNKNRINSSELPPKTLVQLYKKMRFYSPDFFLHGVFSQNSLVTDKSIILGRGNIYMKPSKDMFKPEYHYICLSFFDPEILFKTHKFITNISSHEEYINCIENIYKDNNAYLINISDSCVIQPVKELYV